MAELTLHTLADCGLVIGAYPRFRYDARGGGGVGWLSEGDDNGLQALRFHPDAFTIPPLHWRTTRFLGLPDEALALLRCRFGPLVPAGQDLP